MASDIVATWRRPNWRDALAGLSVAGLLLPEAVAYAGIGNMPPQAGVLALMAGLLVYALTGGSRFAIVSATSSSAAVLLAAMGPLAQAPEQELHLRRASRRSSCRLKRSLHFWLHTLRRF